MNKDYYVYAHYRRDDDLLFYIGKGKGNRKSTKSSRSKEWKNVVEKHGFYFVVVRDNLSENEALEYERELVATAGESLINKVIPSLRQVINYREISELFYYDPESPSCLRWKADLLGKGGYTYKCKDKPAGGKNGRYWRVECKGEVFQVHRIIFLLLNPDMDQAKDVDHKDGDGYNNKRDNLRLVTREENMGNRVLPNKSGFTFVTLAENYKGTRPHYLLVVPLTGGRKQFRFYFQDSLIQAFALNQCLLKKEELKNEILSTGVSERAFYGKN